MTVLIDPESLDAQRTPSVLDAAVRLLTRRTGVDITLVEVDNLATSRTVVIRARVGDNPFSLPRTIVVKQLPPEGSSEMFTRELVSYQFTTSLAAADRTGPDLLAWDLEDRVLVITDLGEAVPLSQVLALPPRGVDNILMAWAQRIGRMHAATAGREIDFEALLHRAGMISHAPAISDHVQKTVSALPLLLHHELGVEVTEKIAMKAMNASKLFDTGTFSAFSPADPRPDNILITHDQGVRFLDYEWGGFRDATLDIAYALLLYRISLSDEEAKEHWAERNTRMIHAWRAEAVAVWPILTDDTTVLKRIVKAQLIWVWLMTAWWLPGHQWAGEWSHGHALSSPSPQALLAGWEGLRDLAYLAEDTLVHDHAQAVVSALSAAWRW